MGLQKMVPLLDGFLRIEGFEDKDLGYITRFQDETVVLYLHISSN